MLKKYIYLITMLAAAAITISGCGGLAPARSSAIYSDKSSTKSTYHYSLAVLLRLNGQVNDAAAELEKAIAADSGSAYLKTELVSLYAEKGDFAKAASLGKETLSLHPDNSELHMIMGGIYFNAREHNNAIQEYETVIKLEPKRSLAYLYLATIYAEEKKYDRAEESFIRLLEIDPDNITAIYFYGKVLSEMNRFEDAARMYQKAISIRPDLTTAVVDLAALYERQQKIDKAIEVYRRFMESNPVRTNIRMKLGDLLIKDKRYDEAKKEFQEALKFDPDNREARIALGLLYYDLKHFGLAVEEFLALLDKNAGDDRVRYLLATTYEANKENKLAQEEYRRISPKSELYANAHVRIGMILKNDGKITEAISVLQEAISRKKDQFSFYLYLSSLYEEKKDLPGAENILKEGIRNVPKNVDLHYGLGVIYEKTNRFEESVREMETVLSIDPNNAEALNFIGYGYADRGIKLAEAEQMIIKALKIKPGSGFMIDSLGWVHFKQNKLESAVKYLKEAMEIMPSDATIVEHLGDVYVKLGQWKEAQDMYKKALQIDPQNNALQKKLEDITKKITQ